MALLNTITAEVRSSPTPIFTPTKETVVTGIIISNRVSPDAFVTLKRGTETLLINERIEIGKSFQLAVKIGLVANQNLIAYATTSPVNLLWDNGTVEDWDSTSEEDWNSATTSGTSVLFTVSYAEF